LRRSRRYLKANSMVLKPALARIAHWFERLIDRFRRAPTRNNPIIDCYGGYTAPGHIVVRGRILAKARLVSGQAVQSKFRNFLDFLQLFLTDELEGVEIEALDDGSCTVTDEEGFFVLRVPNDQQPPAQLAIRAVGTDEIHHAPVFAARDAPYGVISDIDDTIIRTGAYSLLKNLWTSATGNVHEREVFDDAKALMRRFQKAGACFFYVSSSPWNLHGYLQTVFRKAMLPLGPFFLRDLGISDSQFITGTHGDHKSAAIMTILGANPDLSFTLVGDTGQHDPHIYAKIVDDFPGRICRVILRRPNTKSLSASTLADIDRMRSAGVVVAMDYDYRALMSEIT